MAGRWDRPGADAAAGREAAVDWHARRSLHHAAFGAERLSAERSATVSVCLPARNELATIRRNLEKLLPLLEGAVIDQLVVVDDSDDGTAEAASGYDGVEVYDQSSLRPEFGRVAGKGDAMWRALDVLRGDIVCYLDADSEDLGPHFVCGLVGPVMLDGVDLAKAFYRRPFQVGGIRLAEGGGRVSELMARPLLNTFYPELSAFLQPLAGEFAARRELLERLPFATGYGVEIAMLIDAWHAVGLEGLAQVDLDVRQNRHRQLHELSPMAHAVLGAVAARLVREGRLTLATDYGFLVPFEGGLVPRAIEYSERPPMASLARTPN